MATYHHLFLYVLKDCSKNCTITKIKLSPTLFFKSVDANSQSIMQSVLSRSMYLNLPISISLLWYQCFFPKHLVYFLHEQINIVELPLLIGF
jgi:hypothetical protein